MLDWGCGMFAAVDCRSADATVLLFDPNGGPDAWYVDAESLTDWLETWLAETGWYEEDADQDIAMRSWEGLSSRRPPPTVG
ncbi:hypothetical protein [Nonomuraea longicatena]